MSPRSVISREQLRRNLAEVTASIRSDNPEETPNVIAQLVAQHILATLFGIDWMKRHILTDKPGHPDFFRTDRKTGSPGLLGMLRIIQLAEMVLNLQFHPGVEKSIDLIRAGDIEPGFAELEVAKLLFVNDVDFTFIEPQMIKGADYDLELRMSGLTACADTKCKVEGTERSASSVENSLRKAKSQLPKEEPGIIFVKIPQTWYEMGDEAELGAMLQRVADNFFKSTQRIVSLKFHTHVIADDGTRVFQTTFVREFDNPSHRFDRNKNWNCYREAPTLPDKWIQLQDL